MTSGNTTMPHEVEPMSPKDVARELVALSLSSTPRSSSKNGAVQLHDSCPEILHSWSASWDQKTHGRHGSAPVLRPAQLHEMMLMPSQLKMPERDFDSHPNMNLLSEPAPDTPPLSPHSSTRGRSRSFNTPPVSRRVPVHASNSGVQTSQKMYPRVLTSATTAAQNKTLSPSLVPRSGLPSFNMKSVSSSSTPQEPSSPYSTTPSNHSPSSVSAFTQFFPFRHAHSPNNSAPSTPEVHSRHRSSSWHSFQSSPSSVNSTRSLGSFTYSESSKVSSLLSSGTKSELRRSEHPQPRGRPPKGKKWSREMGKWIDHDPADPLARVVASRRMPRAQTEPHVPCASSGKSHGSRGDSSTKGHSLSAVSGEDEMVVTEDPKLSEKPRKRVKLCHWKIVSSPCNESTHCSQVAGLPLEILADVFSFLSTDELSIVPAVNKTFKRCFYKCFDWVEALIRSYPVAAATLKKSALDKLEKNVLEDQKLNVTYLKSWCDQQEAKRLYVGQYLVSNGSSKATDEDRRILRQSMTPFERLSEDKELLRITTFERWDEATLMLNRGAQPRMAIEYGSYENPRTNLGMVALHFATRDCAPLPFIKRLVQALPESVYFTEANGFTPLDLLRQCPPGQAPNTQQYTADEHAAVLKFLMSSMVSMI